MAFTIIVIVLCGGAYFYFDKANHKRKTYDEGGDPDLSEKTAQDFVNVRDIGEHCLYTLDGKIFAYIKIDGICLELFSDHELRTLSNNCSKQLSKYNHPYKYIAVSRRVDLSKTLRTYQEIYSTVQGGRRALIRQEIEELAALEMSGDTLERQHYIAVWCEAKDEHERELVARATELAGIFSENRINARLIDGREIVRLCGLVNVPDYAHIENSDIDTTIAALMNAG
jgi:hypothetical protein